MKNKKRIINYTSRDFNSIKSDLENLARVHYPDTYKDFSENSFGSFVLDAVAYVGDMLSFYLDYQVNETFLETAIEYDNIRRLAKNYGYKFRPRPAAYGLATFYVIVPAASSGLGPDTKYIPILKTGSEINAKTGATFVLTENVDFNHPKNDVVAARFSDTTGKPTSYAIRAYGQVKSTVLFRTTKAVGGFTRFRRVRAGPGSISEIISVVDSEGHEYFQVEHLSQDVIYIETTNSSVRTDEVRSILKPKVVPRRFVVEQDSQGTYLQFGFGSDEEILTTDVLDPSQVSLKMSGRTYISDDSFDPTKLLDSNTLGVIPSNTTLTIIYEANDSDSVNVNAGGLDSMSISLIDFPNSDNNSSVTDATVRNSIEVSNDEPIVGNTSIPTSEEIKVRSYSSYASQGRIVTKNDYEAYCYIMPSKFGSVKRANVISDPSFTDKRISIYVINQDNLGNLVQTNQTIKDNLKVWLNKNRMITDRIDIYDAIIMNIGFDYRINVDPTRDKLSVLNSVNRKLKSDMSEKLYIGEPLSISNIYNTINKVNGVVDVKEVNMKIATGGGYSNPSISIEDLLSKDGTRIVPPKNIILEIKNFDRDVRGTAQ